MSHDPTRRPKSIIFSAMSAAGPLAIKPSNTGGAGEAHTTPPATATASSQPNLLITSSTYPLDRRAACTFFRKNLQAARRDSRYDRRQRNDTTRVRPRRAGTADVA